MSKPRKKLGKITEKQSHFIRMFVGGIDIEQILLDLDLKGQDVTRWMYTNSLFIAALNSEIFLKENSLYLKNLNVRSKSLEVLDKFLEAGNLEAVSLALNNIEDFKDFNEELFSPKQIKEDSIDRLFRFLEMQSQQPPKRRRKKRGDDDDNNSPPF